MVKQHKSEKYEDKLNKYRADILLLRFGKYKPIDFNQYVLRINDISGLLDVSKSFVLKVIDDENSKNS